MPFISENIYITQNTQNLQYFTSNIYIYIYLFIIAQTVSNIHLVTKFSKLFP